MLSSSWLWGRLRAPCRLPPPQTAPVRLGAAEEGGETRGGPAQARRGEIDRAAIDRPELPLAHAKGDADQIGDEGWIARAPNIPRPGAAAQNLDMLRIGWQHDSRNR